MCRAVLTPEQTVIAQEIRLVLTSLCNALDKLPGDASGAEVRSAVRARARMHGCAVQP